MRRARNGRGTPDAPWSVRERAGARNAVLLQKAHTGRDSEPAGDRRRQRLIGREAVIAEIEVCLAAGRSVLLVGPEGSGKTAIIEEVRRPGLLVVDPFARITSARASSLRRALNRGAIVLAAARSLERRDMGHVGRIFWRFRMIHLRPLSARQIARVLRRTLAARVETPVPVDRTWMAGAIDAATGLPGRAVALASVVAARWREGGVVVPPRFAFVIARQDGLVHLADVATTRGCGPGEPSS